jgi:hypothetical protein
LQLECELHATIVATFDPIDSRRGDRLL